jgi:hypothetical protein
MESDFGILYVTYVTPVLQINLIVEALELA